jgi:hypothetical protein
MLFIDTRDTDDFDIHADVARNIGGRMKYDPTRQALYSPEIGDPVEDFNVTWERDQLCAELSRLAYVGFERGELERLKGILHKAGFGVPECFHKETYDAQAFVTMAPDGRAFVAFRGTQIEKPRDILADINALPVAWKDIRTDLDAKPTERTDDSRVHRGFAKAYFSLRDEIEAWLKKNPHSALVLTGHSLGAAMATLMAADHAEADLVTFGSPRVGDKSFASQFDGRLVRRYVDCADGVPDLPPPAGYRHVCDLVYIDRRGKVREDAPTFRDRALDRLAANFAYLGKYAWRQPRNVLLRSFADHAPINYVSAALDRRDK